MDTYTVGSSTADTKVVLMISLDTPSYFDAMYAPLINQLHTKATIKRARKAAPASRVLTERPNAVLLTDPHLTKSKRADNTQLLSELISYVKEGGTLICMGTFSSTCPPAKLTAFFQQAWGLQWKSGDYHRAISHRNPSVRVGKVSPQSPLPHKCSMKALHLCNVERLNAMYLSPAGATTNSMVPIMDGIPIADNSQTPVAFTDIDNGCLGYIGDVNGEEESTTVILVMCELAD